MEKKELKSCSKGNKVVAFDEVSKTLYFHQRQVCNERKQMGETQRFRLKMFRLPNLPLIAEM